MQPNKDLQRTLEAEGYITVARAAALLPGVRTATIYSWIDRDKVGHRAVGDRVFVLRVDVERVLGLRKAVR